MMSKSTDAIAAALSGRAIGALGGNVNANQLISRASGQILKSKLRIIISRCWIKTFSISISIFPKKSS